MFNSQLRHVSCVNVGFFFLDLPADIVMEFEVYLALTMQPLRSSYVFHTPF